MLLKHSEVIKKSFTFPKQLKYKSKWIVLLIIFLALILILASYFNPIFGKKLHDSTQWLGNISPLAIVIAGYFLKEEITNWRYKKTTEAACEIIGKFRTCSYDLIYWINTRTFTPTSGKKSSERKIQLAVTNYIKECLEPSSLFSIQTRKELDNEFKKMRKLADTLSGAVKINTDADQNKTYGNKMSTTAFDAICSINSTLADYQNSLDQILAQYLEK